ncbi:hypothetical protein BOX15_Mlig024429g1 [Macrostomum lignano]|uniref:Uncharacterized protein n=1 Tax=Macrostomum lignano TaxID=282301 RepID=A0A267GIX0_9PLAT|nr:hypothetical protein BOX15_Mlig024429g3 [Macrostomum lignano]PAA86000.1 hypothetical protein BOX15_Mlig024429g2 [Macrostomum lignano]PAA89439.1 hypothetical protein BOX15_Mlig024429g1 [Macrostomum lignano]
MRLASLAAIISLIMGCAAACAGTKCLPKGYFCDEKLPSYRCCQPLSCVRVDSNDSVGYSHLRERCL